MIIIIVLVLSLFYYELERFECDLYFAEQFSHFLRGGAARMFHGGRVLCRAGRPTLVATQSQEIRKIRSTPPQEAFPSADCPHIQALNCP